MTDGSSGNTRVTMAVLAQRLEFLIERQEEHWREWREFCTESVADRRDLHSDVADLRLDVERIKVRQGIAATLNAAFTAVASAIAGWLGTR